MQSPEILTRPENPNPKWPVPKDLIELQPSYKQVCILYLNDCNCVTIYALINLQASFILNSYRMTGTLIGMQHQAAKLLTW